MNKAFITGTSQGLGKSLAEKLLNNGWIVEGIGRTNSLSHLHYSHITADLSDRSVASTIDFPLNGGTSKLVLINNAGSLGEVGHLGNLEDEELTKTVILNFISPVVLINRFLKQTREFTGERVIVNISSGAALNPYDGWSAYCGSKAGLEMLSRTAELEQKLAGWKTTRVFSIAPGILDTAMQEKIRSSDAADFSQLDKFVRLHEEGKLSDPADVAAKLLNLIDTPEKFPEMRYDFRDL